MSQFRDQASLHPTEGARFLFERETVSAGHKNGGYRVVVFTPDDRFEYRADMSLDGTFEVTPGERSASADNEKKLRAIAKLIARSSGRKQSQELPPWPHRVLRWRGPGR